MGRSEQNIQLEEQLQRLKLPGYPLGDPLAIGIICFIAEGSPKDVPDILMIGRMQGFIPFEASNRDVMLTLHMLIDFNWLAFTTTRLVKAGPRVEELYTKQNK
ncbi:hypothetical protein C5B42_05395 [Candidatus Cerribacteria bacterium 'Amazon FNV 2010 28 9']|uniref:Uncharacterized protein n=1 Tax=Candidatus Cerribacteria bacterium 'Amazon FNV 2010 28 9' TaxID=2081795 RepID=A0A317JPY4_9BACT|nr:MAG: hypothetical protein C5B42_05395 [Candidatus Cerribacteria bacterium 'Amazon FNV 2010 28 9']